MKRKGIRRAFLVLVLLTLTIALGGCSGDKEEESSASSSITVGIPQDIEDSLDPHKTVAAGTEEIFFNLYEGLVKADSSGNLQPAVASDYSISEDGKVYTFTLREGILFHDNSPVTVDDVKYSIERCADTSKGEPLVSAFSNIEAVSAPDDKTVEITLKEADTEFLAYLTEAVIPASNEDPGQNAVGTGPFMFVSHSPQESFVMKRFDGYWGEKPALERVTLKVCANADAVAMDLKGGSIDMMARVSPAQAEGLGDDFEVLEGTMNLVQALFLNNKVKPFDDVRVRRALSLAVDKQEIMSMIADGKGTPIGSSMFPAFEKYYVPELNDVYKTDIEKAKALLAEAGYPDGFSFTITVPSNYTQHVDTAQILVEQFKRIGVKAEINLVQWEAWLSDVYADRNYEATVVGLDASSLTARALLERYETDAGKNFINYSNPSYDAAYEKARSTTDDNEKTKYYKECERILTEDAASVYIQDLASLVAVNKKYTGYEFYPLYVQDYSKLRPAQESD